MHTDELRLSFELIIFRTKHEFRFTTAFHFTRFVINHDSLLFEFGWIELQSDNDLKFGIHLIFIKNLVF